MFILCWDISQTVRGLALEHSCFPCPPQAAGNVLFYGYAILQYSRLGAPRQHITGKLLLKTIARRWLAKMAWSIGVPMCTGSSSCVLGGHWRVSSETVRPQQPCHESWVLRHGALAQLLAHGAYIIATLLVPVWSETGRTGGCMACRNPWFSQGMIETTWLMSWGRSLGPQHCKGSSSCVFSKAKGQVRVKALPCHESWVFRRRCLGAALLARGAYGSAAAGADVKWDRTEGNMACNSRWFIQTLLFQQLHWWVRVYGPVSAACFHRPHCFYICGLHHVRIKGT